MRLYRYLTLSSTDEDVSTFRSLHLDLVEDDTGNSEIVQKISDEYALDDSAQQLLDRANAELKKMYRGKLKFDFCMENEGLTPDSVKIERKKVPQFKEKWFKINDELSEIQITFEERLKKSLQK